MKKWSSIAESFLFAGNLFLAFLLIFGDKIVEPTWMQVTGRMHPLLLHFPIVLLLMAVLWEWLPLRGQRENVALFKRVDQTLLLTGAVFAVITAIMGMLLSLQDGYDAQSLMWHKWSGAGIAFLSYFYYSYKHSRYHIPLLNKITGGLLAVCLLATGHLGANITHGSNFLLQPLEQARQSKPVPINQAVVYDHLIEPLLQKKCMSCHNHRKAKGDLVMETRELFLKGGKDGKLFLPGSPDSSLLIRRIHLPLADDDHMPPEGKPQLTEEETALLYWWIKSGAPMDRKVTDLPATDSLRILATRFLLPATPETPAAEKYDFPAADNGKISSLNTNYRIVTPLAQNSPALAVNFYNKQQYTAKSLEELEPVAKQIVDLNLAKMPVTDGDLKIISRFENLRKLNLNFTEVSNKGLTELKALKHLQHISVSGTAVTYEGIRQIIHLPALKEVFIWSDHFQPDQVALLGKKFAKIHFETGFLDTAKRVFQLPPPLLKTPSGIFSDSLLVQINHAIQGTQIRYTTDDSEPDSIHSPVYTGPFTIRHETKVKAKAYKTGWSASTTTLADYLKASLRPDSMKLLSQPDEKYKGQGSLTLTDRDLGDLNYGGGGWLGYRFKDAVFLLRFQKPVSVHSVSLHCLKNLPAYIWPPAHVEIWGGDDPDHLKKLGESDLKPPVKDAPVEALSVTCPLTTLRVNCIKIVAKPVAHLPAWHAGKGEPAWIMVNEILLN